MTDAKSATGRFVEELVKANRLLHKSIATEIPTQRDRERSRATYELSVRFFALSDLSGHLFAAAPGIEEVIFGHVAAIIRTSIAIGKVSAPEGSIGRETQHDNARARRRHACSDSR